MVESYLDIDLADSETWLPPTTFMLYNTDCKLVTRAPKSTWGPASFSLHGVFSENLYVPFYSG